MDYSNMQLLVMLVLDGVLGVLCGWSLRRWLRLEGATKTEAALQKDLDLLQSSAARSSTMLNEAREALKRAEADTATLRGSLAVRTAELAGARVSISDLQRTTLEKSLKVTSLELRVAALESAGSRSSLELRETTAEDGDDLKQIFGIGKVCERKLNEAGVRRFSQIAAWSIEDVERFKALLPKWGERILRDKWVEQARELHEEKSGATAMRAAC
jgi:predicted flap endonuclease-1-like 5' DNA nuclease